MESYQPQPDFHFPPLYLQVLIFTAAKCGMGDREIYFLPFLFNCTPSLEIVFKTHFGKSTSSCRFLYCCTVICTIHTCTASKSLNVAPHGLCRQNVAQINVELRYHTVSLVTAPLGASIRRFLCIYACTLCQGADPGAAGKQLSLLWQRRERLDDYRLLHTALGEYFRLLHLDPSFLSASRLVHNLVPIPIIKHPVSKSSSSYHPNP